MDIEEESNYDDIDNLDVPGEEDEEDRGDLIEEGAEEEGEEAEGGEEEDTGDEEGAQEEEKEETEEEEESPENKIPLSRLNQVIAQRDEQKDRVAWLESQLERNTPVPPPDKEEEVALEAFDFDKAEEDYQNLFLEGETAKAAKLRGKIRSAEREELTRQISEATTTAAETAKGLMEGRDFEDLVNDLEVSHPFLDSSHKSYNEEAVSMVNSLMTGYTSDGSTSRVDALNRAVTKLAPMFLDPEGTPEVKKPSLGSKTKDRKIASRKRAAETSIKQPTKLKGKGGVQDLGEVDVEGLSDKAFSQLSLKELKALRGD